MFEQYPSLLITKLYAPRLRSSQVARSRLTTVLDAGLDRKLILIAAAAGFGKTTLVTGWINQRGLPVCWLSLDEGDNDPLRFLSYLVAGIQLRYPAVGRELLAVLQSPQPPSIDNGLHSLVNQIAGIPDQLVVVLDDYHIIENQHVHRALTFLLDHLPSQTTVVLMTRTDPALPLARLRAKNELVELRAADLRFSLEEADYFLNQVMRLGMSTEAIRALERRTEGWVVGLQLAGVAMQSLEGDQERFVQNFSGSHRFILDYLIEEVLSRQPENVRRFLLHTSVLRRLNGNLCSTVTGTADGQAMIEHLERHNLFVVALDQSRYWYRYHHLFADLLQARLQSEYPSLVEELHSRAAHWHEQNGLPEEAIYYALTARDYDYAAQLITGPAVGVMHRGEVITLLEWYKAFPADFPQRYPSLCLHFGLAFALNGRWDEAENLLKAVEQGDKQEARPDEVLMLAYLVASKRQDVAGLEALAVEAASMIEHGPMTKIVLGLLVSTRGDFRHACQLMAEAQDMCERRGDVVMALTALFHQCRFHAFAGNLHQAYVLSERALKCSQELGSAALPMAAFAHVSLGRILIEWNRMDEAAEHLHEVIRLAELTGLLTGMISSTNAMLAEVKQAQGDSENAMRFMEIALAEAERYDPPAELLWLQAYQTRLWLVQGNSAAAVEWLRESQARQLPPSIFYPDNIERVTQARVLLARRKIEEAMMLLTKLMAEPPNLLRVEILNLLALSRQAHGDSVNAQLALEQALALAEPENRIRTFVEMGAPMAKQLSRFREAHPDHEFVKKLLVAFPTQAEGFPAVEPLGERELEVLRLIVAGQSNDEIAQTLTLAVSTVKWYINVLYGKLHVKTRSQAIARAHDLKLV